MSGSLRRRQKTVQALVRQQEKQAETKEKEVDNQIWLCIIVRLNKAKCFGSLTA
jgi:hypothetical protein